MDLIDTYVFNYQNFKTPNFTPVTWTNFESLWFIGFSGTTQQELPLTLPSSLSWHPGVWRWEKRMSEWMTQTTSHLIGVGHVSLSLSPWRTTALALNIAITTLAELLKQNHVALITCYVFKALLYFSCYWKCCQVLLSFNNRWQTVLKKQVRLTTYIHRFAHQDLHDPKVTRSKGHDVLKE